MAKHSGYYGSKKRQKEIARLNKQEEKRQRRFGAKNQEDVKETEGEEGLVTENTEQTLSPV